MIATLAFGLFKTCLALGAFMLAVVVASLFVQRLKGSK